MSDNDNVVALPCVYGHVPPDGVLDGAKGKLTEVLLIGECIDGLYLACSTSDAKDMLWLLERAKADVMRRVEIDEGGSAA